MKRTDPLGPEFYVPLARAERVTDGAFFLAGVLSIAVLLIDRAGYPQIYDAVQASFVVLVIVFFVSGLVVRTYFSARAQSNRAADFVSNAFLVPVISTPSTGYYNTTGTDPYRRMGSALLENALFTKAIVKSMLVFERLLISVYVLVWLWAALSRATDLGIVAMVAQVLFSEQLVSRWVRMEWLRARVERVYDDIYRLFQSTTDAKCKEFCALVVEGVIRYETSKAQAGVSLSSRKFHKLNHDLSEQWTTIATQLGIGPSSGVGP